MNENELVAIDQNRFPDLKNILQAKYERALTYLITGQTPKDVIRQREVRGGKKADYVPGWWFQEQLNALFGGSWSFTILERHVDMENSQIWVSGELIIETKSGQVIKRPGTGGAEIDRHTSDVHRRDRAGRELPELLYKKGEIVDLADDVKSAETEALSRAARWLGFAADVYNKREEVR